MTETERGLHGENCACPPGDYAGLGVAIRQHPLDLVTDAPVEKYLVTAAPLPKEDFTILNAQICLSDPPPPNLVFYDQTEEVGRLEWKGGLMTFTGNTDASAKMFFDVVCANFNMVKPKEIQNGKD